MITKKEIEKMAELSRLSLSDKEEDKIRKELDAVLDFADKLMNADINKKGSGLQENNQIIHLRPDEKPEDSIIKFERNNGLIAQAPSKENNFIKIKSVFKNDR